MNRIVIFTGVVLCLLAFLIVELVYVQIYRGEMYHDLSVNNRIRVVPMEGSRGEIKDRFGRILAENRLSFHVALIPQELSDGDRLFDFLSDNLSVDKERLEKKYRQKKLNPFTPVVVAENITKEQAIQVSEHAFLYPGLIVQESFQRYYPYEGIMGHVTGYVGKVNSAKFSKIKQYGITPQSVVGYSGVEEYYDSYLRGQMGGRQIEVNSRGQEVNLLSLKSPAQGEDIMLTIDVDVQKLAYELLDDVNGSIVIMDVQTGELLSMVSSPGFNPNYFADSRQSRMAARYFSDQRAPLLNRAIAGAYPPGSTFKLLLALGALADGEVKPWTSFFCPGYYKLGDRQFRCTHVHEDEDLTDAILHSCNTYFYYTGLLLGPNRIAALARKAGFGLKTGIDLPFETNGNVPHPDSTRKRWYKGDTLNFSIGQGDLLATPLQVARFMALIANNGRAVTPHVLKSIGAKDVLVEHSQKYNLAEINSDYFDRVKTAMRYTVERPSGTAYATAIDGLRIYGKTGTAQSGGDRKSHSWFAGFAKLDSRTVSFCVFLEHGGSSYNAVLVTRKLFIRMKDLEAKG